MMLSEPFASHLNCTNTLVSVIVPVYNTKKEYLLQCIDSILQQTYTCFELIIIDDGSNIETKELCESLKDIDNRIIVVHKQNGGVSSARNFGISISKGDYITFIDSDDVVDLRFLELMLHFSQNCDIVACNTYHFGRESTTYSNTTIFKNETEGLVDALKDSPYTWGVIPKLFKRVFINDVRFEENARIHEDSYFIFTCMLKSPSIAINQSALYGVRVYSESSSHSGNSDKYLSIIDLANRKVKIVKEYYPQYTELAYNIRLKAYICYYNVLIRNQALSSEESKEILSAIQSNRKYYITSSGKDGLLFMLLCMCPFLYNYLYRSHFRSITDGKDSVYI